MTRIDDLIAEHCPDGVEFLALRDVGVWYGGGTPSKQRPEYWAEGTIPWLSPKDMGKPIIEATEDYITDAAVTGSATKLVPANSVAIVVRSSILDRILPTALIPIPITLNQDMKAVVTRDGVMPGYLAHMLRSLGPELLRTVRRTGGSVASIEVPKLLASRVPVPPLAVQQEIVAILDNLASLECQLEAELEAELEYRSRQHEHYRSSMLSFPESVPRATLVHLVSFINGKPHERLVDVDGDVVLMTARFISTQGNAAKRFVRRVDVLSPAADGDIALVMSDLPNGRALARAFFIEANGQYAANQRVCLLRVVDERQLLPRFLYHTVNRNQQLLAYDNRQDQTHLKKGQILGIDIPLPPLAEQERIVAILDNLDALVSDLSNSLPAEIRARRQQYMYLRDQLLTFEEKAA